MDSGTRKGRAIYYNVKEKVEGKETGMTRSKNGINNWKGIR
jgi:hypothetical protein